VSASVVEALLARVAQVLTTVGLSVHRGRADGYDIAELPVVALVRQDASAEPSAAGMDVLRPGFDLHCITHGADWETTADAIHMQAHAALFADATLSGLCKGLRCTSTSTQPDEGGDTVGRVTASYQAQIAVRGSDLTRTL
jgi:hypothetical protein